MLNTHPVSRQAPAAAALAALALAFAGGCAQTDEAHQLALDNEKRFWSLKDRFDALKAGTDALTAKVGDLQLTVGELNTRLSQVQLDIAQLRDKSPALQRFETSQERQGRLAELLAKFDAADDAAWLQVKEGLIRVGAIAVGPLLERYGAGDVLALRRVPQVLRALVDAESLQPLAAGLENPKTRSIAAEALGLLGNPEGVPYLRAHLADPDADTRHTIAVALGRLKDRSGVPVLLDELASDDTTTRLMAIRELEQITGQDFGFSAYEKDAEVRAQAIQRARDWWQATQGGGSGTSPKKDDGGGKGAER